MTSYSSRYVSSNQYGFCIVLQSQYLNNKSTHPRHEDLQQTGRWFEIQGSTKFHQENQHCNRCLDSIKFFIYLINKVSSRPFRLPSHPSHANTYSIRIDRIRGTNCRKFLRLCHSLHSIQLWQQMQFHAFIFLVYFVGKMKSRTVNGSRLIKPSGRTFECELIFDQQILCSSRLFPISWSFLRRQSDPHICNKRHRSESKLDHFF